MEIEIKTPLEKFRKFIIYNTCLSFIPKGYLYDVNVFPERSSERGEIYVEAASKIELARIRDIRFVKVMDVLGIIYKSKSGNTNLKWRQLKGNLGKLSGSVSPNSVVNLIESKVLTREYIERMMRERSVEEEGAETVEDVSSDEPQS
ncbi:MAG: hypothetical protein NZ920_01915 [Aigarchaeota archaeon]|nr:hypothetical protein [Aigarchaeota archaeon]MDW8093200.1 hypothetical protein [Nitrososphaerota archaeon]